VVCRDREISDVKIEPTDVRQKGAEELFCGAAGKLKEISRK